MKAFNLASTRDTMHQLNTDHAHVGSTQLLMLPIQQRDLDSILYFRSPFSEASTLALSCSKYLHYVKISKD